MNLWDVKGVPHKGWKCEEVIDVGDENLSSDKIEYEQCEMCGNEKIRYVHIMKHDNYFKELRVLIMIVWVIMLILLSMLL